MYRFIEHELQKWKQASHRKPLIIRGARQVGKTYSILEFGRKSFDGNVYHIDLEKRPDLHPIFEPNLDVKRILSDLEIALQIRIVPGKDLLFFDEIQACPRALMALRYFYEELPQLHVIAAGSLLEFTFKDFSFPVGRIQFLDMYPMSFIEFLLATGNEAAIKTILNSSSQIPSTTHDILLEWCKKYFFVGGMPECVNVFKETQKFSEVREVQQQLIQTYQADFSKYTSRANPQLLTTVLTNSARSVGEQVKYERLAEGFSNPTKKNALHLLAKARLVQKIPAVNIPQIPLGANAKENKFKLLFLDIGLMQTLLGVRISEEYYKYDLLAMYQGKLAEQFVGQELLAYANAPLYYWRRAAKSSTAEVDFLFERETTVVPVEVKRGPAGRLKSLHLLLESYPHIPQAYVVSSAPEGELPEKRLKFLPFYRIAAYFAPEEWKSPML